MRHGASVESVIVRAIRLALALLMFPIILVYAVLAAAGWLFTRGLRPADRRAALVHLPA